MLTSPMEKIGQYNAHILYLTLIEIDFVPLVGWAMNTFATSNCMYLVRLVFGGQGHRNMIPPP